MACDKDKCDCKKMKESQLKLAKFVGICVDCGHPHSADDELRHQLAQNDKVPNEIATCLYLGGLSAALNREELVRLKITRVVNCCPREKLAVTSSSSVTQAEFDQLNDIERLLIDIVDDQQQDLTEAFAKSFAFIDIGLAEKRNVLIHCRQGVSRSASLATHYLMVSRNVSYDEALAIIRKGRPIATPNVNFERQLRATHKPAGH